MKPGWQEKSLGQIGKIFNGDSINENEKKRCFQGLTEGTPYIGTKDVGFDHQINYNSGTNIPFKRANDFKLAPTNAVLVCAEGGSAGRKVAFTEREVFFGNKLFAICPEEQKSSRFVYYFCLSDSFAKQFKGAMSGLIGGVSINKFKNIKIPFPALNEQQQIATKLDEVFEGLAKAKENAQKNLQNARALFESHLQIVFSQRGKGWVDRQLASLCREITVGHVGPMKKEYKGKGIPFLRSQNIRPFEVTMENAMFIDETFHRLLKKSQLRPGDLAIVRTGYPGTAAVIPPELTDSNCSDLVIVRPTTQVDPHFLAAFFNSAFGKQLVLGKIVGAAQKHFNITAAKNVMLHVPSIPEQRAIVKMVDDLRKETQRLAGIYEQKLVALETFKRSILHEAFSGNL